MTKPSRCERARPVALQGAPTPLDSAEYARAVGNRVTELVERALERAPDAVRIDPNSMAEVITELVVDKIADPDRSDLVELVELVAPLWTAEHARRVLHLSRATMLARRKTGSLLAVKTTDHDYFYPVAQFEKRDGKIQVKHDLRKFMMVLRDRDSWTIAVLVHTPSSELDELTPLDWIREERDTRTLLDYAAVLNTEYAR